MEEILKIVIEYASIWAPSIVAILGVVYTILQSISRTKSTFDEFKKNVDLKEVNEKLTKLTNENEELVRCNKLLLDNITKIQNYADEKKRG